MRRFFIALTFFMLLQIQFGCNRRDDPVAPPVTAADRALPIPIDNAPAASGSSTVSTGTAAVTTTATASGGKATAPLKVSVEDTLEPVPIDDASVPGEGRGAATKGKK